MALTRRGFLKLLGNTAAVAATAPLLVAAEDLERRLWVPRNYVNGWTPSPSVPETFGVFGGEAFSNEFDRSFYGDCVVTVRGRKPDGKWVDRDFSVALGNADADIQKALAFARDMRLGGGKVYLDVDAALMGRGKTAYVWDREGIEEVEAHRLRTFNEREFERVLSLSSGLVRS